MSKFSDDNHDDEIEFVSKTQIKKEMHDLQELGMKLARLGKKQRDQLPVSDSMQDAFILADKIKNKHEAFKRHGQYMGKLLREEDLDAINQTLDLFSNQHQQQDKVFHQYESLRDDLIANGDSLIHTLMNDNPTLDRQKLRQLVRQASKEVAQEKPGKNHQSLLNYLRQHIKF